MSIPQGSLPSGSSPPSTLVFIKSDTNCVTHCFSIFSLFPFLHLGHETSVNHPSPHQLQTLWGREGKIKFCSSLLYFYLSKWECSCLSIFFFSLIRDLFPILTLAVVKSGLRCLFSCLYCSHTFIAIFQFLQNA